MAAGWRIAILCMVQPVAERLVPYVRELGHEPVGIVTPRVERERPPDLRLSNETVPHGLDLLFAADKWRVAPLLRSLDPDLVLSWGFSWKLPPEALEVPRLGCVNQHPALLPRHRGPVPLAWALRDGDDRFGVTWHRMDAELDTGGILAQGTVPIEDDDCEIMEIGPKLLREAFALLPRVFERVAAGDPGDAQDEALATWAGHFEDDDYARVDWSWPARRIHDQVRAWGLTFGLSPAIGPLAELDGERVRLVRTSLVERDGARRVECGDGPLWIVSTEPA